MVLVAAVAAVTGGATMANGYVLEGCRFNVNGIYTQGGKATYKYSNITSAWSGATSTGASRWNAATSTPDLIASTGSSGNIWVYDDSYSGSWYGLTTWAGCAGGGAYWSSNQVQIQFNLRTTGSFTTLRRQDTATHEEGHAWGLGHMPNTCSKLSIMADSNWIRSNCGSVGTPPWADDVSGKNSLY